MGVSEIDRKNRTGLIIQVLVIVAILNAFVFAVPAALFVLIFSVVGIPVALVLGVLPAATEMALIAVPAFLLIRKKTNLGKWLSALLSAAIALVLLWLPTIAFNSYLDHKTAQLVSGDHNDVAPGKTYPIIALGQVEGQWRGPLGCGNLCLRLLLSENAEKVQVFAPDKSGTALSLDTPVDEYHFAKATPCPKIDFHERATPIDLQQGDNIDLGDADPISLAEKFLQSGKCLQKDKTTIASADLVISLFESEPELWRFEHPGLALSKYALAFQQMTAATRNKNTHEFKEIFRETKYRANRLAPLLVPIPDLQFEGTSEMAWARSVKVSADWNPIYNETDIARFLVKKLGVDIAINQSILKQRKQEVISAATLESRAPTKDEWLFYADKDGDWGRQLNQKTYDLAFRTLKNPLVPPPPTAPEMMAHVCETQNENSIRELRDALLSKAEQGQTWPNSVEVDEDQALQSIGAALDELCLARDDVMFKRLVALAHLPAVQLHGRTIIKQLHYYNEAAEPVFRYLLDTGLEACKQHSPQESCGEPYISALANYCLMGRVFAEGKPHLMSLVANGTIPMHAKQGMVAASTIVRMGASPEDVWPYFAQANPEKTKADFDKRISQAGHEIGSCFVDYW